MPSFSRSLEKALHQALAFANERRQEYATLEHLLLSLIDDQDAAAVMRACNVEIVLLKRNLVEYIDTEIDILIERAWKSLDECYAGLKADGMLKAAA